MKTIIFLEEAWTGHRPIFLKLFNKVVLELGYQVITFCPQPKELEAWLKENCQSQEGQYTLFEFHRPVSSQLPNPKEDAIFKAVNLWQTAKQAVDGAFQQLGKPIDHLVFFGVLDGYLATGLTPDEIDKIFPYSWTGLYFNPRHLRMQPQDWSLVPDLGQPHAGLYSANCSALAVLDEGITNQLEKQLHSKSVSVFPDCVDVLAPNLDFPLLSLIQQKAKGRKIVGLLGSQSKRKSIFTLVEVAQQMATEDFFFIFIGPLYPKTFTKEEHTKLLELISLNLDNCLFYLDVIQEADINGLVYICDVLFAAYEKFPHSSNTLNRAAAYKKPIIVSENYCMEERVNKYNLGISVQETNAEDTIKAIRHLSKHPLRNPHFQGYLDQHTLPKLSDAFNRVLTECLKIDVPSEVEQL